ncbi:MAG: alcohol dehydrogenase catalytic domain-containing protein [Anaerolineae bacterium]|nr:alcohol dehydrogenase catalytic domain-containing protein [Anaerolineae bacterium]
MKAVVYDDGLRLSSDYPLPQPAAGEVRLRTLLAGICNTDLEVVRGYAGFRGVLGHEFIAVVDQAEDPRLVGRRVVGEINASCGTCQACRAGRRTHCPNRTALGIRGRDGALAEYFCLPVENLHPVPEEIPDRSAVFVEPLAAACRIPDQVHLRPSDRVVVLGDGKLGLLVAQVLALTGCHLLVIGRHPEKLAILAARGIAVALDRDGLPAGADLVVECTGQAGGFDTARQMLRPEGTLVLKSTYHGLVATDLSQLVVDEIRIVGSRCGPFPAALRLLEQGLVSVEPLIEAVYPLDEAVAALEHAGARGALKILVQPEPAA